jgi:hypothetical protein
MSLNLGAADLDELWGHNRYLTAFSEWAGRNTAKMELAEVAWMQRTRERLIGEFGFAVPDAPALDLIARCSPVVDLGAGRGYWASLLQAGGAEVVPIDKEPQSDPWTTVLTGDIDSLDAYPEYTLMMIWPPLKSLMARNALARYHGSRLVYVGEAAGGCCAEDGFFDLLERDWDLVKVLAIPTWPLIHDQLFLYSRKTGSI